MLSTHWQTRMVLLSLVLSGVGCALPGRQSAQNGEKSSWNPFAAPQSNYADGSQAQEEEELSDKNIKDPIQLKLSFAAWREEAGDRPEAKRHYSEVLKEQPKNVEAILGVARIEFSEGHIDQAEQGFRRALKVDSASANAHRGLGQCQAAHKQWAEAVASLTEATKGLPEDKTIRHQLAIALVHTGDISAAQLQFTQSVGAAAGHYNTALILKDQDRLPEAEEQLELALRKDPKMKDAERWLVELRKSRNGARQAAMSGPLEIQPHVTQSTFRDYGAVGTVEIEPAVYLSESMLSGVEQAGGHSVAAAAPPALESRFVPRR